MEGEAAVDQNVLAILQGLPSRFCCSIERRRHSALIVYIDEHLDRTACCCREPTSRVSATTLSYAVDNAGYVLALRLAEFWLLHSGQTCQCEAACELLWSFHGPRSVVHPLACR